MNAVLHFTWLALQGACCIALFLCLLRIFRKLPHADFVRYLGILLPLWCLASGAILFSYHTEAFIALYGNNPYEGVAFVKDGQPVSHDWSFAVISFTAIACLLPFLLIFRRLRNNIPAAFGITLLAWTGLVALAALST